MPLRRRLLLPALIGLLASLACSLPAWVNLPGISSPTPAPPTATLTPQPTLTPTPSPSPTPTPTPLPAARIEAGQSQLFYGDWQAAQAEFQTALAEAVEAPVQAAALLGMGRAYAAQGAYPEALEALRQAARDYPDSPSQAAISFQLGQIYTALDRFGEAAAAYQQYLALRPGVIDAYAAERQGDALLAAGDPLNALYAYQSALQAPRAGSRIPLQTRLAQVYVQLDDPATALVIYQDIYNQAGDDPTRAQMLLQIGNTYALLGDYEKSNAAYLEAIQNYPLMYDSYTGLVELVNRGVPVSELTRGIVDYYAGQYGVALAAFDRYLASAPTDPAGLAAARYYRGLTFLARQEILPALDEWQIVMRDYAESPLWDEAWEEHGYTQWAYLEQYDPAVETFLGFVERAPNHPRASQFLDFAARVAERDGQLQRAADLWIRLANEYPGATQTYRALFLAGVSLYRLGDHARALATFQLAFGQAVSRPDRAAALLWIGKTHQSLGQAAEAAAAWQQAAAIDPTGYYSERAIDLLAGKAPFAPPGGYDLSFDRQTELSQAQEWLRATFGLGSEADLNGPGPLTQEPAFQRGNELWSLGLYTEARLELEALRAQVSGDPANTFRLANHLVEIGMYRSGILATRAVLDLAGMDDAATLNAPRYFNRLRYGPYFGALVIPAAQEHGFHPLFLFSVIRLESLFEGFVRSSAGARGLMQIIPSTGESLANRLGWPPGYTADDLYRPLVSITLGSEYLAQQRDAFGGDVYAALAAYNGGPGNASRWKELAPDDPDLFLEIVRFEETRNYIRTIYEIYSIYYKLYDRSP
jgi:soluble lytic murein transglycosylase